MKKLIYLLLYLLIFVGCSNAEPLLIAIPTEQPDSAEIEPTSVPTAEPTEAPAPIATVETVSIESESVEALDLTQLWSYGLTSIRTGEPLIELESSSYGRSDSAYQIPIVLEGSLQNPTWSPDGKAILFTRFRNGYNKGPADLVIYNLENETTRILVFEGSDNINLPGSTWNRVTNKITFASTREPHDEIFIIGAGGNPNEEIKVTDRVKHVAYEPSFSPNGQWIVFESHEVDVENNGIITKYKIDGTEPYQMLTDENDDCRQPNWSPEGQYILYQTLDDGQWEIWVMNSDGTNQRQITNGPGDKTDASFSPDGEWIVYSADGPTLSFANLFIKPVLGEEQIQVTFFNGYDGAPSWSPNGKKFVFEASLDAPEDSSGTTIWIITAPRQ